MICFFVFVLLVLFHSSESSSGSGFDQYQPKTSNLKITRNYGNLHPHFNQLQCALYCTNSNIGNKQKCNGYISGPGMCAQVSIAEESYTDFNPSSNGTTIFINSKPKSINYRFVTFGSWGTGSDTSIRVYSQLKQQSTEPWELTSRLFWSKSGTSVEKMGTTFNFESRIVLACGGLQNFLVHQYNLCWYLETDVSLIIPPWKGPLTMKQDRTNPSLINFESKTVVFGGAVPNGEVDIVEVFDGTQRTLGPLKDGTGTAVRVAKLANLEFSCSVVIKESNSIMVTGGKLGATAQFLHGLLNINTGMWTSLPDMSNRRANHACARVTRRGKDYVVIAFGNGGLYSGMEFYDLSTARWYPITMTNPNPVISNVIGYVIKELDINTCDVFIVSFNDRIIHICKDNYIWSNRSINNYFAAGYQPFVAMDANLFASN